MVARNRSSLAYSLRSRRASVVVSRRGNSAPPKSLTSAAIASQSPASTRFVQSLVGIRRALPSLLICRR